jgi:hypothetical protein
MPPEPTKKLMISSTRAHVLAAVQQMMHRYTEKKGQNKTHIGRSASLTGADEGLIILLAKILDAGSASNIVSNSSQPHGTKLLTNLLPLLANS